jgi:hypothetical protein
MAGLRAMTGTARAERMGSAHHYPEEGPSTDVEVGDFWIDAVPVRNRDFAEFGARPATSCWQNGRLTLATFRMRCHTYWSRDRPCSSCRKVPWISGPSHGGTTCPMLHGGRRTVREVAGKTVRTTLSFTSLSKMPSRTVTERGRPCPPKPSGSTPRGGDTRGPRTPGAICSKRCPAGQCLVRRVPHLESQNTTARDRARGWLPTEWIWPVRRDSARHAEPE